MNLLRNTGSGRTAAGILALLICLLVPGWSATGQHPVIRIHTSMGTLDAELYPDRAPVTAGNFLVLVEKGTYTGASFYRVVRPDNQPDNPVKIGVVQGGLLEDSLIGLYPAVLHETTRETGILHTDGVLSMARNEPGSASTEFFICIGDQPSLDYGGARNPDGEGFAAFGKLLNGMNVVRAIQGLPDHDQMLLKPVKIHRIERLGS